MERRSFRRCAGVETDRAGDPHTVEQLPIVGDEDHRAGEGVERLLQLLDRR